MNESEEFWEAHYLKATRKSSGKPSAVLKRFVEGIPAGRALDLGCSRGDDSVWLAKGGWRVVGVDVSKSVLDMARRNADNAGVSSQVSFEQHDLGKTFPEGQFDLVSVVFLESPVSFPREEVLRRAASAVAVGGRLIVVRHGSAAPWSWGDPDREFPTAQDELNSLELDLQRWNSIFVGPSERTSTGPGGQTAQIIDNIVVLERRAESQGS